MNSKTNWLGYLCITLTLSFNVIGYGQTDSTDNSTITRQSLETAINRGFIIDKIKGIELRLGGHVQVDAFFDTHKTGSTDFFKASQITLPSESYPRTLFNIKDSRIRISAINKGDDFKTHVKMLFEVDFRNPGTAPRIRHAWVEVGDFGLGQTWSNLIDTDAFPNIILNTGGPNSFSVDRSIQFRYSHQFNDDVFSVAFEDHQPNSTVPDTWDVRQIVPSLTAGFKKNLGNDHLRFAVLLHPINYNSELNPNKLKTEFGYAGSITGSFSLGKSDKIKLHTIYGSGFSGYIEDLNHLNNEAVVIDDKLETINLFAGWFFYEHQWNTSFSSSLGYGINDFDNKTRFTEDPIDKTHFGLVSVQYQPLDQFKLVLEGIYGKKENFATDQLPSQAGDNVRVQLSTLYVF